jgi:hypothetical protein
VDFEKNWDYTNGDVNDYYSGGTAADGTSGSNLGVSFVGVSGLSNDPNFTYYTNAPSLQGVAYAYGTAYMNVAAGVDNALSFSYSSLANLSGAVRAWTGLNGTGTLLGSFDLGTNDIGTTYDTWTKATFSFAGTAQSFDFTGSANAVAFDNISAVPVPAAAWLFGTGLAMFGAARRRGKASV